MEGDHSIKTTTAKGASISHATGGHLQYPKHVWSPAGGWNGQPRNWKGNTAIMGTVILGLVAVAWTISADREHRTKFPEPDRFYPSRWWSREIREHEKAQRSKQS